MRVTHKISSYINFAHKIKSKCLRYIISQDIKLTVFAFIKFQNTEYTTQKSK